MGAAISSDMIGDHLERLRERRPLVHEHHELRRHELDGERASRAWRVAGHGACARGGGGVHRHIGSPSGQYWHARPFLGREHVACRAKGGRDRHTLGAGSGRRRRDGPAYAHDARSLGARAESPAWQCERDHGRGRRGRTYAKGCRRHRRIRACRRFPHAISGAQAPPSSRSRAPSTT